VSELDAAEFLAHFGPIHAITSHGHGPAVVHLELLPGDPLDYADALRRAHLLSA